LPELIRSVRQFVTLHILRPLAHWLGIKGGKVMRFLERERAFGDRGRLN
jgi:hypothetical protein